MQITHVQALFRAIHGLPADEPVAYNVLPRPDGLYAVTLTSKDVGYVSEAFDGDTDPLTRGSELLAAIGLRRAVALLSALEPFMRRAAPIRRMLRANEVGEAYLAFRRAPTSATAEALAKAQSALVLEALG